MLFEGGEANFSDWAFCMEDLLRLISDTHKKPRSGGSSHPCRKALNVPRCAYVGVLASSTSTTLQRCLRAASSSSQQKDVIITKSPHCTRRAAAPFRQISPDPAVDGSAYVSNRAPLFTF